MFLLILRLPPISHRTDTFVPYPALCLSVHTQFTADVRFGLIRFMLFDRRNDLALADSCLFHRSVVKVTNSRILTRPIFWEGYRSEEHTSELQSLMRISYTVYCLKQQIILLTMIYQSLQ